MSPVKQIIGALGDLGQEIIKETISAPSEILGLRNESSGSSKKSAGNVPKTISPGEQALQNVTTEPDENVKRARARSALEMFAGSHSQKEPDEWDKKKKEEENRKKEEELRKKQQQKQALPQISSKPKQGQRYGIHEKTTEASKNVKAE